MVGLPRPPPRPLTTSRAGAAAMNIALPRRRHRPLALFAGRARAVLHLPFQGRWEPHQGSSGGALELAQLPDHRHARPPGDRRRAGLAGGGARCFPVAQPWLPDRLRGRLPLWRPARPQARFCRGARAHAFPFRLQRKDAGRRPQAAAGIGRQDPQAGGERHAKIPLAGRADRGGDGPVARRHGGRARQDGRHARRNRGSHRVRCMAQ